MVALGLLLLDGVEQSRRGFLLWRSDRKEVATTAPAGLGGVRDLVVRVEAEVLSRLVKGRVQDRIFDDGLGHGATFGHACGVLGSEILR